MANIKGINIEIGGNTSPLVDSLKNVNKVISSTNKSLSEVNRALKFDPKNTETLALKQKILAENISATEEKLQKLKTAQSQMADTSKLTDEQKDKYKNLSVEIAKSESALKKMNDELEKMNGEEPTKELNEGIKKVGQTSIKVGDLIKSNLISEGLIAGIKAAENAVKKLASTMLDIGKKAISNYADYEQLVGGVESMFGGMDKGAEQINKVMDLSKNAWENLTMSQNDYITSFNATYPLMKNDIEDQNEAIEKTNRIMTLNSDLANTFGYSMEQASTAVNWALKGTYSYLDNLNIGIKGTKEGFLEAAKSVGYTVESVNELSSSDILDILEKCANKYGVLGKTADEAKKTIQGSVKMMQASWKNMLTGIADDNADFSALIDNFINSIVGENGEGGVLNNLLPRINKLISGIGDLVKSLLEKFIPQILPILIDSISEIGPSLINSIKLIITTIVSAVPPLIQTLLPELVPVILDLLQNIIQLLLDNLPMILDTVINVILEVSKSLAEMLPTLIPQIMNCLLQMVDVILNNIDLFIDAAIELIIALIEGISEATPMLIEKMPEIIIKIIEALYRNFPKIVEAGWEIIGSLVNGIIKNLGAVTTGIGKIISKIKEKISELPKMALDWGKDMIDGFVDGIKKGVGKVGDAVKSVADKIKNFLHFSRPDIGPLRDYETWMPDMIKGMAKGIDKTSYLLENATSNLADKMSKKMSFNIENVGSAMKGLNYEITHSSNPLINPNAGLSSSNSNSNVNTNNTFNFNITTNNFNEEEMDKLFNYINRRMGTNY